MSFEIGPMPPSQPTVAVISLPPSPPPEVLDEVAAARDRAAELAASNRELHFSMNEASGRVIVQERDLAGNVIRAIPPSGALAVMSGRGGPVAGPSLSGLASGVGTTSIVDQLMALARDADKIDTVSGLPAEQRDSWVQLDAKP
jgi:hypothetical protein